jgi:PHP domain
LTNQSQVLRNADIACLLAAESETALQPLQKAYRRAARRAFLWPEEAYEFVRDHRLLTEFSGVGPFLEKRILSWIKDPRPYLLFLLSDFIAMPLDPPWRRNRLGHAGSEATLQMHSNWSDGSGSIRDMAEAALQRNYECISITDHSKGLKIAGSINEDQLKRQAEEISEINRSLKDSGKKLRVLRSIELNLNPCGQGDMDQTTFSELDIVLGCFHSSLRLSTAAVRRQFTISTLYRFYGEFRV